MNVCKQLPKLPHWAGRAVSRNESPGKKPGAKKFLEIFSSRQLKIALKQTLFLIEAVYVELERDGLETEGSGSKLTSALCLESW